MISQIAFWSSCYRWFNLGALSVLLTAECVGATAFTYQGRIQENASPANGSYDLQVSLFSTPIAGAPLGSPIVVSNLNVNQGLFACSLDFGLDAFDGSNRWLELGIRSGGSGAEFTILTPRQALTPAPLALHATAADSAQNVLGVLSGTNGGTGQATYAIGDLLVGAGPGALARLPAAASGNALVSTGIDTSPVWDKISLANHVTDILPIDHGGTGAAIQNFLDLSTDQIVGGTKNFTTLTLPQPVLDQQQPNNTGLYLTIEGSMYQSFTPASNGNLSRIDVYVVIDSPFTLQIRADEGLAGAVLLSQPFPQGLGGTGWRSMLLSSLIPVSSGRKYSFVLTGFPIPSIAISPESYPGGQLGFSQNSATYDWQFRTYLGISQPLQNLFVDQYTDQSVSGVKSFTSGILRLGNGTNNLIDFGSGGSSVPSGGTGWKLRTYGQDYGIGIEPSTQWYASSFYHKWYFGSNNTWNERMRLDSGGNLFITGNFHASAVFTPSDKRLKTNIVPLTGALKKIQQLNGVSYQWNEAMRAEHPEASEQRQIGLIAQDVECVYPEAVATLPNGFKAVDYTKLVGVLVQAAKELKEEKDRELDQLQQENAALKQRLDRLEQALLSK